MTFGDRDDSAAMDGEDPRRIRRMLAGDGAHRSVEQGDAVPDAESLDSDESPSKVWLFCINH
jgi:hypothetical protein